MAGRQRKKPRRRKRRKPIERLQFLCEGHFSRSIRDGISAIPGYSAVGPGHFDLALDAPDRVLIEKATEHAMLLLTWNGDTIDHIRYPPGTHAGVIKLRLSNQGPILVTECLGRFLRTEHYKRCRRSVVELTDNRVKVWGVGPTGRSKYDEFEY